MLGHFKLKIRNIISEIKDLDFSAKETFTPITFIATMSSSSQGKLYLNSKTLVGNTTYDYISEQVLVSLSRMCQ